MIDVLRIKNLALIDDLEIEFGKGLNIITGETGAGKSIIVNSFQLLLGKRINKDIIRTDAEMCEVEGVFDLDDYDDFLIIKRILTKNNKNKVKINDNFETLNSLKSKTERLIDFSAQNQFLFDQFNQLQIYDLFCNLKKKKDEFKNLYDKYLKLNKILKEKKENKEKIYEKLDILKFQLKELEESNLENIDEEFLKNDIEYYENVEIIKETLNFTNLNLEDKLGVISEIKAKISNIKDLKQSFSELLKILENVEVEINEILNISVQEISDLPEDSSKLDELIDIENKINFLKKKHNVQTVEELLILKENLKREIERIELEDIELEKEKKELEVLKEKLERLAIELHGARIKFKNKFEREIEKILKELNMEKAKFVVDFEILNEFTDTGKDRIKFLISTNEGEEPKPLVEIASGGEKSRIMLALKSFLSEYLQIPILVFDEIDAGTGGKTAFSIGKLLKKLSRNHQVFAITHFPQVAAFADNHYKVYKISEKGKTFTKIKKLNEKERIEELSRMISGNVTEKSKLSAEELINEAKKSKC